MKKIYLIISLLFLFGCFNPNEPVKEKTLHEKPIATELILSHNNKYMYATFYAEGYKWSTKMFFPDHDCLPIPNPVRDSFKLRIDYYWCEGDIKFYLLKAVFVLDQENKLLDYLSLGNLNIYAPYYNSIIPLIDNYNKVGTDSLEFSAKQLNLTPGFYRIYMETKETLYWIDMLYDPDDVIFKKLIRIPHTTLYTVY